MKNDSLSAHDRDLAECMPESVARENRCVPLRRMGDTLVVGYSAAAEKSPEEDLRFILNRPVRMIQRTDAWISARLMELYDGKLATSAVCTEDYSTTWYWPGWHWFEGDTLYVKCTGFNELGHWTGCRPVGPNDPEIKFWIWIVKQSYFHRLIEEREIPKIKRIWRRYVLRTGKTSTEDDPVFTLL